jgi:hypothetical protein
MNILRRIEGLRDWLGLHKREKRKRMQRNRGAKALNGEVCSIDRKGIGIMDLRLEEEQRNLSLYGKINRREDFA